ncbi:MAG: toll/interleukin-1 receptor domain-containing protein [Chitinophagaceae bacterium]|nr:MAG: toll/interleukin-1 receptor domain-containing protein [Chitinophagaceae bacterium]
MADVFLSYSSADKSIVKGVAALLEKRGWSVWWDRQIPIGQRFDTVIESELHNAGCVVVIWTKNSVASEWVKNEAADAAQRGVLVPLMLEDVTIPLAFRRIEAAMLTDWKGEEDHPELAILYQSIETILRRKEKDVIGADISTNGSKKGNESTRNPFGEKSWLKKVLAGPALYVSLAVIASLGIWWLIDSTSAGSVEKNVTVRVFDWKRNPVTQGEVKIYLDEYIRTQSLDKMGQAVFTGLPVAMMKNKKKIEVSSPGYSTRTFDTLLANGKPLELVLPLKISSPDMSNQDIFLNPVAH